MATDDVENASEPVLAKLNSRQRKLLSLVTQDIRATVSHLSLPKVSPLAVLTPEAMDNLKDLYYMLNTEDPLNAMPVRQHVLSSKIPVECLLPITTAAYKDPASSRNQKRWALPTYQTLRLMSVLTLPVAKDSDLPVPCPLDYHLIDLRTTLSTKSTSLQAFVALLQFYIDRKAQKKAALLPAEQAKLEDARIGNILRFFTNILSPPRHNVPKAISDCDRPVHLALVGSLVSVEFFSTLSVLFCTPDDARSQYTDVVFLVSQIFALAYRHSTPIQIYRSSLEKSEKISAPKLEYDSQRNNITSTESSPGGNKVARAARKSTSTSASILRNALARDRTLGTSRAVSSGARWSNRHSGSVSAATSLSTSATHVSGYAKRIISTDVAVRENRGFNSMQDFQEGLNINSQLLCKQALARKMPGVRSLAAQVIKTVRKDLQERGMRALVSITEELIDVSFQHIIRELRARITEVKERAQPDESEALATAQRSFLSIVCAVVGYKRESRGKVSKVEGCLNESLLHQNSMLAILAADFKIVEKEWKEVESAIELESFQLVFGVLVEACDQMKESGKDDGRVRTVETATSAILQMMKMLQGMAAVGKDVEKEGDEDSMTPREISMNILEQLFERESFLNAPADLAKNFSSKVHSFDHLSNIVELTHTFTTILLDEGEFKSLQVAKKKRKQKLKDDDDEQIALATNVDGQTSAEKVDLETKAVRENTGIDEDDTKALSEIAMDSAISVEPAQEQGKTIVTVENENSKDPANSSAYICEKMDRSAPQAEVGASGGVEDESMLRVKRMLEADEKQMEEEKKQEEDKTPVESAPSKVKMMLEADKEAALKGAPEPQYVMHKDEAVRKGLARDTSEQVGLNLDAEESEDEQEMRQVESIGIVRRFAHTKALESLLIPIRTAMCQATELSGGKVYPTPDGAHATMSASVVAKSAKVFSAVWSVAKGRERGALCGQFFTFSTLHVLNLATMATLRLEVKSDSVLGHLGTVSRDVSSTFMIWLSANPALMYDMFFPMDKAAGKAFASASLPLVRQQERLVDKEKKPGSSEVLTKVFDSDSEYSDVDMESDIEAMAKEMDQAKEAQERKTSIARNSTPRLKRKRSTSRVQEGDEDVDVDAIEIERRIQPDRGEDDEDVDVDELHIGRRGTGGRRGSARGRRKRTRVISGDDESDMDGFEAMVRKRVRKMDPEDEEEDEGGQSRKRTKGKVMDKAKDSGSGVTSNKVFDSASEYSDADLDGDTPEDVDQTKKAQENDMREAPNDTTSESPTRKAPEQESNGDVSLDGVDDRDAEYQGEREAGRDQAVHKRRKRARVISDDESETDDAAEIEKVVRDKVREMASQSDEDVDKVDTVFVKE